MKLEKKHYWGIALVVLVGILLMIFWKQISEVFASAGPKDAARQYHGGGMAAVAVGGSQRSPIASQLVEVPQAVETSSDNFRCFMFDKGATYIDTDGTQLCFTKYSEDRKLYCYRKCSNVSAPTSRIRVERIPSRNNA